MLVLRQKQNGICDDLGTILVSDLDHKLFIGHQFLPASIEVTCIKLVMLQTDVCVDLRVGLLSPALFHPLLQMHSEELTRYLSGNFIVEGADSRRTKTI